VPWPSPRYTLRQWNVKPGQEVCVSSVLGGLGTWQLITPTPWAHMWCCSPPTGKKKTGIAPRRQGSGSSPVIRRMDAHLNSFDFILNTVQRNTILTPSWHCSKRDAHHDAGGAPFRATPGLMKCVRAYFQAPSACRLLELAVLPKTRKCSIVAPSTTIGLRCGK